MVLPSGLQYEIIKEGTGKKPQATDQVRCHYEGTLIDGTLFDSSIQRGEPAVFGVNQVIPGWVEALQLMPEGSKMETVYSIRTRLWRKRCRRNDSASQHTCI